jgi:hypothetical protein
VLFANIAYLASGKLRSKNGYTPKKHHVIPKDFAAIGVATSPNPASDEYILNALKSLGILRVRLDFTYGDFDHHVARFLERLIHENFKVHLHLVQPFEEAKRMKMPSVQSTWQQFVRNICVQYGQQVSHIEIGSTINRKRWAGYTLNSFLKMWEIAYTEIKPRNLLLAGPSITDFEPLYNIGILSILKKRGQLPDIHTDNLFSERCTEPERDDHKILGHKLAPLGGFRLVKKAFVLQEIGQHFDVPRFHSPSAFWTLPRIERFLPDSEQKQADYLARYMLLCAASGAMESAGWGPLICHREGLIDDAVATYPKLERITLYQLIGNRVENYRVRPAFQAFQTFIREIPGLSYQGQQDEHDFLEVHAFANAHRQVHAVWTTNGKVAALSDIYSFNDLNHAKIFHRDGHEIQTNIACESPIYIHFASAQAIEINANANIIHDCAIHAHMAEINFYHYQQNGWRGMIAAKNHDEFALLAKTLNPQYIQGPSKQSILRNARNAIWTIPDPRSPEKKLVLKQPVKFNIFKRFTDKLKPSKGLRSWSGAHELLRRDINNAKPVAYFELVGDNTLKQNFYICEFVPADFSVRDMFSAFANGEKSFAGITQEKAYQVVCDFLFNMHQRGAFFRDLSGGNILCHKISETELTFSLIDTGRARFFNHGTPLSMRLSDMARACNKLHPEGRNALMTLYMQKMGKRFGIKEKIPFISYNIKVSIKRQLKIKNIKKLLGITKKKS